MAIAFDNSTAQAQSYNTQVNFSHTCSGGNRILFVGSVDINNQAISNVTYNGIALTLLTTNSNAGWTAGTAREEVWYLVNPPLGTFTVSISYGGTNTSHLSCSASYNGVTGVNPIDVSTSNTNTTAISLTTTIANDWMIAFSGSNNGSQSAGSGTTKRNESSNGGTNPWFGVFDSGSPINPAGTNTLNFTGGQTQLNIAATFKTLSIGGTPLMLLL